MRTLCDVCENAAAILFCAADEAALCRACDDKVHMCNKLASRHVRVGLADPSDVPRCDICENAPGDKTGRLDELGMQTLDQNGKMDKKLFDLNTRPQRINGSTSNNLDKEILGGNNHDSIGVVPVELFKQEAEK
ncbi:hypothetical protein PIB30_065174 [Stylosanthes scabra]|uniref:B box-type domain-containing protein n=1 Tax=Stylosanthes scabra TaxID=79078 RepID=A0ABU6VLQ8_9FABA|nr:hypothetical protein [Stylosanthes scabra]